MYAQNDLNRWATAISSNELTDQEVTSLAGSNHPTVGDDLGYVRFADAASLSADDLYTVRFTDSGLEYTFDVKYVEINTNGDYYLSGTIGGNESNFDFTSGVGFNGSALIDGTVIDFVAISETLSALRYVDVPDYGDSHNHGDCFEFDGGEVVNSSEVDLCSAVVDVLFLRTTEVENNFPYTTIYAAGSPGAFPRTVENFVDLVVEETRRTNETLANSQIGSKRINAIFHDTTIDDIDESSNDMWTIRTNLIQNTLIQQLRQQYDADAVVMYFNDWNQIQYNGVAGGIPATYSTSYVANSFSTSAHAVEFPKVCAHELGHLFGGKHSRAFELTEVISGDSTNRPTIMHAGSGVPWRDTYGTVSHYSNENVNFILDDGLLAVTGSESRNNAVLVSNDFCNVAEFEQSGGFSSFVKLNWGNSIPLCHTTMPLCADVISGNEDGPNSGPYTYEWRYSIHPSASTTVFSTDECPSFSMPFGSVTTYYITIDVTDVNSGEKTSATKVVSFNPCIFEDEMSRPSNLLPHDVAEFEDVNLSIGIGSSTRLISSSIEPKRIDLYSIDGVRLSSENVINGNRVSFDVRTPSGLYYVVILGVNGKTETHPVWYVH